jgi:hypothetical protein
MTAVEERRVTGLLKTGPPDVLAERQDLLREALRESLEEMSLLRAIQPGERTPMSIRKKAFRGAHAPASMKRIEYQFPTTGPFTYR